jgi:hypothetical protein
MNMLSPAGIQDFEKWSELETMSVANVFWSIREVVRSGA